MPITIPSTKPRSRLGNAVKSGADADTIAELRRDYRASRAAEYLASLVAEAPPLTDEQLGELQGILGSARIDA